MRLVAMWIVCLHVRFEIVAALEQLAALIAVTRRIRVGRVTSFLAVFYDLDRIVRESSAIAWPLLSLMSYEMLDIVFLLDLGRHVVWRIAVIECRQRRTCVYVAWIDVGRLLRHQTRNGVEARPNVFGLLFHLDERRVARLKEVIGMRVRR